MFIRNTKATTSIDYALIAVGISITIMAVVFTMGDSVGAMFDAAVGSFAN